MANKGGPFRDNTIGGMVAEHEEKVLKHEGHLLVLDEIVRRLRFAITAAIMIVAVWAFIDLFAIGAIIRCLEQRIERQEYEMLMQRQEVIFIDRKLKRFIAEDFKIAEAVREMR